MASYIFSYIFWLLLSLCIIILFFLLLFIYHLFFNLKAFFSGGNLKGCAYQLKFAIKKSKGKGNNYPEIFFIRLDTILSQCKNRTSDKKMEISAAIPQISNYTELAIFDYFARIEGYYEGDSIPFLSSVSLHRDNIENYLQEYRINPYYIKGDHREETYKLIPDINNILQKYGYPPSFTKLG